MLLTHTFAVQKIQVWERHHGYLVEVLDEGDPIRELADADLVAHSTDRWAQLILFNFAIEELFNIVDIEATASVFPIWQLFSLTIFFFFVFKTVRLNDGVTNCIQVALVHVLTASDIQTGVCKTVIVRVVIDPE